MRPEPIRSRNRQASANLGVFFDCLNSRGPHCRNELDSKTTKIVYDGIWAVPAWKARELLVLLIHEESLKKVRGGAQEREDLGWL